MVVRRISNDELYHHGVKGQSWGVKNGPPYPLDSSVSTGERLKAQKKASKLLRKGIPITRHIDSREYAKNIKPFLKEKDLNDMLDLDKRANSLFKKNKKIQALQKKEEDLKTRFYNEIDKNGDSEKADKLSIQLDKATRETVNEFERWEKTPDGKKYGELRKQHAKQREEYVKNLLGKYAGKKVRTFTKKGYEDRLGDLVDRALIELTTEDSVRRMNTKPNVIHNTYSRKGQVDWKEYIRRNDH